MVWQVAGRWKREKYGKFRYLYRVSEEPTTVSNVTEKLEEIKNSISTITQVPLAEHGARFHEIHRDLNETLTAVEGL